MSEVRSFDSWTNGSTTVVPLDSPVPSWTMGKLMPQPAAPQPFAVQPQAQNTAREILAAHYIRKSYRKASMEIPVLQGVELAIREGEFVSVIGPSGCGKSTLLHVLATLDAPDSGEVCFEGNRIDNLPAAGRDILRNRYFGMVFQFYHLLPELTTIENVLAPAMIGQSVLGYWRRRRHYRDRAREMLELVNMGHRLKHKPSELSGGEMQRTAIARALVARPRVLLADEPTGNLDKSTGDEIMSILRRLNREQKLTIVMVTHDPRIAEQADRTVTLVDGRVVAA
ncbi:MAG TPA: ABC transporter ATP-binding protein [Lacipirellulaceae bacterium]|jgi:lipoprotein-releasing system ATP-binding protein|nr:ABC transporter ATP-binding protein [Lacipirellulaceae bacterium]